MPIEMVIPERKSRPDRSVDEMIVAHTSAADALGRQIVNAFDDSLKSKMRVQPQTHLRASSFGHPCDRKLYHDIVDWKTVIPFGLQAHRNFERGAHGERYVIGKLREFGFIVVGEQRDWYDESLNLSGRIEGHIVETKSGAEILIEIKSSAGYFLKKITGLSDDELAQTSHVERIARLRETVYGENYYVQVQIYLYLFEKYAAMLLIHDLGLGRFVPITIPFDFDFAASMIERAIRVNKAIAAKQPPPYIEKASVCKQCRHFKRACFPSITSGDAKILTDPELHQKMVRHSEIKPVAREAAKLEREIKADVRDAGEIVAVGEFLVTNTTRQRKSVVVPPERKAEFTQLVEYVTTKWERGAKNE